MNKQKFFTKLSIALAVTSLISMGAVWQMRRVHADPLPTANPLPTAVEDQTSFGTIGLAVGQTMRVSVANTVSPNDSTYAPPCRVLINFRDMNGDLVRNRSGQVIFRLVQLDPGQSAYLDLGFGQIAPSPGTNIGTGRIQIRPVINSQLATPPEPETPPDPCVPVVEVFNDLTGRTAFGVFTAPAVRRTSLITN